MIAAMKYPTFCLFALILLQKRVEPLKCYECDTKRDGIACNDPLNQTLIQLKTCEKNEWMDSTQYVACNVWEYYPASDSNMSRVIRSCFAGYHSACWFAYVSSSPHPCIECSTDGCNKDRITEKQTECEKEIEKEKESGSNKVTSLGLFIFIISQVIPLMK